MIAWSCCWLLRREKITEAAMSLLSLFRDRIFTGPHLRAAPVNQNRYEAQTKLRPSCQENCSKDTLLGAAKITAPRAAIF